MCHYHGQSHQHQRHGGGVGGVIVGGEVEEVGPGHLAHQGVGHTHLEPSVVTRVRVGEDGGLAPGAGGGTHPQHEAGKYNRHS